MNQTRKPFVILAIITACVAAPLMVLGKIQNHALGFTKIASNPDYSTLKDVVVTASWEGPRVVPVGVNNVDDAGKYMLAYGAWGNGVQMTEGDTLTQSQLLTDHRVFQVPGFTHVQVLDVDRSSAHVAVLDGIEAGRDGYVFTRWLYKLHPEGGDPTELFPGYMIINGQTVKSDGSWGSTLTAGSRLPKTQ